jgi:hypothetical protein
LPAHSARARSLMKELCLPPGNVGRMVVIGQSTGPQALLHLISSRRGESRDPVWRQISKASSSNATATRRATSSSNASS